MQDKMILKLKDIYARYEELSRLMSDPEVIADTAKWTEVAKAQAEISETAQKYAEYAECERQLLSAEEAAKTETDADMRELFAEEAGVCRKKLAEIREEL